MLDKFSVHVTIPVAFLDRAKNFYKEILGLTIDREDLTSGIVFKAGKDTKLFIYEGGGI